MSAISCLKMSLRCVVIIGVLIGGPSFAETIAITNGKVVSMGKNGTQEGATVLMRGGKIAEVGHNVAIPDNARIIDAKNKWVTPGLFNVSTTLAAREVGSDASARNVGVRKVGFNAAFDISYGLNPTSTTLAVAAIEGITRAGVKPVSSESIFAGHGALIQLNKNQPLVFQHQAFMQATLGGKATRLGGGARGGALTLFYHALKDALSYRDASDKNLWRGTISRLDAEALLPVATGKMRLMIDVNKASDIEDVLDLVARYKSETGYKLNIALSGAAEGWLLADKISALKIPVVTEPWVNMPKGIDLIAATRHNASRLIAAGVEVSFIFSGSDAYHPRRLSQSAGNAVAHGTSWQDAFAAITINPAKLMGQDEKIGSLESGKVADVVIWDGDPLELLTTAEQVFIAGEAISMETRQTKLRDRYRNLHSERPAQYHH